MHNLIPSKKIMEQFYEYSQVKNELFKPESQMRNTLSQLGTQAH